MSHLDALIRRAMQLMHTHCARIERDIEKSVSASVRRTSGDPFAYGTGAYRSLMELLDAMEEKKDEGLRRWMNERDIRAVITAMSLGLATTTRIACEAHFEKEFLSERARTAEDFLRDIQTIAEYSSERSEISLPRSTTLPREDDWVARGQDDRGPVVREANGAFLKDGEGI